MKPLCLYFLTVGLREAEAVDLVVDWFARYDLSTENVQSPIILHSNGL